MVRATGSAVMALLGAAEERPEGLALATLERSITWGELASAAGRLAQYLRSGGVETGQPVALWLRNGVDWVVGFWGVVCAGCVPVPLSTRSPPSEIRRLLGHSGARALLTDSGDPLIDLAAVLAVVGDLDDLSLVVAGRGTEAPEGARSWDEALGGAGDGMAATEALAPDEETERVGVIQYTSGTTGQPKGALLPERGLLQAASCHAEAWRLKPGEALFVPNPFFHVLGLVYGVVMPAVARLVTLTLPAFDVEQALVLMTRYRAVALTGAPTHFQMLADESISTDRAALGDVDLSTLRVGLTGGARIAVEWAKRVQDRLGLETLINGYGMSEVGSVAQTAWGDAPDAIASSVGLPMPWLEVRVVASGSGAPLAPGEPGELQIRGPSVMMGYLGEPELTAARLDDDGWLRTGDLVRRHEDGRLDLVGRLDEQFTVGGFNVHPGDVAKALEEHPAVEEAHVVGAPDERLGAVSVAFVRSAREAPPVDVLLEHCRRLLRRESLPRRIVFVEELPRNAAGKVDARRLLASLETAES